MRSANRTTAFDNITIAPKRAGTEFRRSFEGKDQHGAPFYRSRQPPAVSIAASAGARSSSRRITGRRSAAAGLQQSTLLAYFLAHPLPVFLRNILPLPTLASPLAQVGPLLPVLAHLLAQFPTLLRRQVARIALSHGRTDPVGQTEQDKQEEKAAFHRRQLMVQAG